LRTGCALFDYMEWEPLPNTQCGGWRHNSDSCATGPFRGSQLKSRPMSSRQCTSMLTKPESMLRNHLKQRMRGLWLMTWHEDKEISPGVPDLSYVMLQPSKNGKLAGLGATPTGMATGHETGWLELKAVFAPPPKTTEVHLKLESSQHQWIGFHLGKIPIHFLVAIGETWYFIDAIHHQTLARKISISTLESLAIASFPGDRVAENSFLFSNATLRTRP